MRTSLGIQPFAMGPHLCVQFHPEADATTVQGFLDHAAAHFLDAGLSPATVVDETRR